MSRATGHLRLVSRRRPRTPCGEHTAIFVAATAIARSCSEGARVAGAEARRTSQALEALAEALRTTATELTALAARAEHLKGEIDDGIPLSQAMAAEERPLIISKLVEITHPPPHTHRETARGGG